jgi:hypothetical protein
MVSKVIALTMLMSGLVAAQEPPPPPDTTRRPQQLPAIETRAPRDERTSFETRPNVGTITITGKELTSVPKFFGESDVLRAIRTLPGVNARNDFSVGMNVRGGEADQNLVLLDGYPIYNPFHMGGLFGAFVEPMVDRVDFLTGGFPAQYGGRLSSVLDVRSAVEPRPDLHGRVDMSFVATTIALGQGMQRGQGTWTIAARRTYADKFVDLFDKGGLPYHFSDVQAHLERMLPGGVRLGVTGYTNTDHLKGSGIDQDNSFILDWGNRLLGTSLTRSWSAPRILRWSLGDSATVTQRFSLSRFNLEMDLFQGILTLNNHVHDRRASGSLTSHTRRHTRSVGYEVGTQRYDFSANYPLLGYPSDTLGSRNVSGGLFYEELWRPSLKWIVQAGARVDAVSKTGNPVFQPRLSVKYFVDPDLAFIGSVGEFAQWAHSLAREDVPIRALDFWVGSDSRAPVSRARHYIAGVERWLTPSRALRIELFLKQYLSLVEQNAMSDPNVQGDEFTRLRGHSYGADLMLRQLQTPRFAGWLAYTFAFSSRRPEAGGATFFPGQDRRHEVNAIGNWTRGRWVTSMRFNLATGTPYTRAVGQFDQRDYLMPTREFVPRDGGFPQFINGPRNAERVPIAQRLDVSFTRNGDGKGTSWSPFFSVMNVYNAKNYFAYFYDYGTDPPERIRIQQLPIFPTLGVSVVW